MDVGVTACRPLYPTSGTEYITSLFGDALLVSHVLLCQADSVPSESCKPSHCWPLNGAIFFETVAGAVPFPEPPHLTSPRLLELNSTQINSIPPVTQRVARGRHGRKGSKLQQYYFPPRTFCLSWVSKDSKDSHFFFGRRPLIVT